MTGWNLFGLMVAIGIPLAVLAWSLHWPEPSDHDDNSNDR